MSHSIPNFNGFKLLDFAAFLVPKAFTELQELITSWRKLVTLEIWMTASTSRRVHSSGISFLWVLGRTIVWYGLWHPTQLNCQCCIQTSRPWGLAVRTISLALDLEYFQQVWVTSAQGTQMLWRWISLATYWMLFQNTKRQGLASIRDWWRVLSICFSCLSLRRSYLLYVSQIQV